MSPFDAFRAGLPGPDALHEGLIGQGAVIDGPFGPRPLIYADYVASGRAHRAVEAFAMDEVLPWYANSHTEASHCGGAMTRLRRAARSEVLRCVGGGADHAGRRDLPAEYGGGLDPGGVGDPRGPDRGSRGDRRGRAGGEPFLSARGRLEPVVRGHRPF